MRDVCIVSSGLKRAGLGLEGITLHLHELINI